MSDIMLEDQLVSRAELPATPAPGYWKSVCQRLLQDKTTMAVSLLLFAILFITIGAPLVTHYDPYAGSVLGRLKPIGTPGHGSAPTKPDAICGRGFVTVDACRCSPASCP